MFAVVESGSITSMPQGNKGIKIGDYNYPPAVFTLWSESERNAIGVYTVEIDYTNSDIGGRPPKDLLSKIKMLFLQHLHNLRPLQNKN